MSGVGWVCDVGVMERSKELGFTFKPVEDDDRFSSCGCLLCLLGFLDYQEALAEYTHGFRCSWK